MRIPWQDLAPETLHAVVEEYVTREGTDYGHADWDLAAKVEHVMAQLRRGEVVLTWDAERASVDLRPVRDLPPEDA